MLRSQIQWSEIELVQNWTARKKFPSLCLPSFLRGRSWLHCSCLCRRPGPVPAHSSGSAEPLPSTARQTMQMCGTAMQCSDGRAPDSTENSHTESFQRVGNKCQTFKGSSLQKQHGRCCSTPNKKHHTSSLGSSILLFQPHQKFEALL